MSYRLRRSGPLLRVLMKRDKVAEVPEPPKNVLAVFVPEPVKPTEDEVLYALEPDRPYDHVVDGL
jgi:hypothetical protein